MDAHPGLKSSHGLASNPDPYAGLVRRLAHRHAAADTTRIWGLWATGTARRVYIWQTHVPYARPERHSLSSHPRVDPFAH